MCYIFFMKRYSFHIVKATGATLPTAVRFTSMCVADRIFSNETPERALRDHFLQSVTGGTFDWVGRDQRPVQEIFTLTNGNRYTVEEYPC